MKPLKVTLLAADELGYIAMLAKSQGWASLTRHVKERVQAQKEYWAEEIWRGQPLDPVDAAYWRGYWEGVLAVVSAPKACDEKLARDMAGREQ